MMAICRVFISDASRKKTGNVSTNGLAAAPEYEILPTGATYCEELGSSLGLNLRMLLTEVFVTIFFRNIVGYKVA
jgi:hypothetical protein